MPESIFELLFWALLAAPAILSLICCRRWSGRWRFIAYAFGMGYIAMGSALVIWIRSNGGDQSPLWLVWFVPAALLVWGMIWGMHQLAIR